MSFLLHVKNYSQKYTMCMHIMVSRDVHGYVHLVHQDSQISFRLIFVTSWAIHTSIGIWYTSSTLIPEASSNYCREMRLRHPRQFRFIHSHSTQEFSFSIFHFSFCSFYKDIKFQSFCYIPFQPDAASIDQM